MTHFGPWLTLGRVSTKANPPGEEEPTRVELFRTQAVGIVGPIPGETLGPANGETFLALKSAGMEGQTPAAPPAEPKAPEQAGPPAAAMKLPAAVKAAWMEKLGAVLDVCAKLAEGLQAAEVDDAAPVPMELVQMAATAEEGLGSMIEPYEEAMMAAPPAPPAQGEPAQKAAPAEGAPAQKPRPRLAMKRIMALDGVAKTLVENATKVGELVGWAKGAAGAPAPAMAEKLAPATKADLDPYTAMSATADAVRERMRCLREMLANEPASVANELRQIIPMVDNLAMLVTQARSGAMAPAAPGAAPAAAPPIMTEEVVQKAVHDGVTSAKGDLLEALKSEIKGLVLAAKGAAASAQAALQKVEKSVPAPNGQPAGELPTSPAGAPPPADPWGTVNQDIQQARNAAARK